MSENVGEFDGLSCLQCLQNMFPQICWMDGMVIGGHFVEGIFSVNYGKTCSYKLALSGSKVSTVQGVIFMFFCRLIKNYEQKQHRTCCTMTMHFFLPGNHVAWT